MARSTDAALHRARVVHTGEQRRNPICELHPRIRSLEYVRSDFLAVPDFAPEPLRGIRVAAFGDEMRAVFGRQSGDAGRLSPTRVVLPEPALRVEVLAPLRQHAERAVPRIDRQRTRTCRVDADADNIRHGEAAFSGCIRQRTAHRLPESGDVIPRVLPREIVVARVQKDTLASRSIPANAGTVFFAIVAPHHEGAHGVGAEINTDRKFHGCQFKAAFRRRSSPQQPHFILFERFNGNRRRERPWRSEGPPHP